MIKQYHKEFDFHEHFEIFTLPQDSKFNLYVGIKFRHNNIRFVQIVQFLKQKYNLKIVNFKLNEPNSLINNKTLTDEHELYVPSIIQYRAGFIQLQSFGDLMKLKFHDKLANIVTAFTLDSDNFKKYTKQSKKPEEMQFVELLYKMYIGTGFINRIFKIFYPDCSDHYIILEKHFLTRLYLIYQPPEIFTKKLSDFFKSSRKDLETFNVLCFYSKCGIPIFNKQSVNYCFDDIPGHGRHYENTVYTRFQSLPDEFKTEDFFVNALTKNPTLYRNIRGSDFEKWPIIRKIADRLNIKPH